MSKQNRQSGPHARSARDTQNAGNGRDPAVLSSEHLLNPDIRELALQMQAEGLGAEDYLKERSPDGRPSNDDIRREYDIRVDKFSVINRFDDAVRNMVVFRPKEDDGTRRPLLFTMHGDGLTAGCTEHNNIQHGIMTAQHGFICATVDYRLAPEHQQPAMLHDTVSGLYECLDRADEFGIDPHRIVLHGGSAGACLAAGLALYLRDHPGDFTVCGLILRIPMLDDRSSLGPEHPYNGQYAWSKHDNYFSWRAALGKDPGSDGISEYFAPARAKTLKGLPPVYISVGSLELFAFESLDFAKRLMDDGVPVELHVYPGFIHGAAGTPGNYYADMEIAAVQQAMVRAVR